MQDHAIEINYEIVSNEIITLIGNFVILYEEQNKMEDSSCGENSLFTKEFLDTLLKKV